MSGVYSAELAGIRLEVRYEHFIKGSAGRKGHRQYQELPIVCPLMWRKAHSLTEQGQRNKRTVAEAPPLRSSHRWDRSGHDMFILVKQPRAGGNRIQLEEYVHIRKSV